MPFQPGHRRIAGREPGTPNKNTKECREYHRNRLQSTEYRESAWRRILEGKAPHLEVLFHHYAYGKPKESVDVRALGRTLVKVVLEDRSKPTDQDGEVIEIESKRDE